MMRFKMVMSVRKYRNKDKGKEKKVYSNNEPQNSHAIICSGTYIAVADSA